MNLWTASRSYRGPDRLDVSRQGNDPTGVVFAPSWAILKPALAARASGTEDWSAYVEAYTIEMRHSYQTRSKVWYDVLAWPEVTLVCYCTDSERCHRTVLAGLLLKAAHGLGGPAMAVAVYLGERPAPEPVVKPTEPQGQITFIMCGGRGRKPKICRWCGDDGTLLCDYPVKPGKSCDAPCGNASANEGRCHGCGCERMTPVAYPDRSSAKRSVRRKSDT